METTKDSREERLNKIEYWWELASGDGFYVDDKLDDVRGPYAVSFQSCPPRWVFWTVNL